VKRRTLLKAMASLARAAQVDFGFERRGGSHDIYRWGGQMIPIPRHREINERLARGVLANLRRIAEGEK
jgi:mRNA interferase HicA